MTPTAARHFSVAHANVNPRINCVRVAVVGINCAVVYIILHKSPQLIKAHNTEGSTVPATIYVRDLVSGP